MNTSEAFVILGLLAFVLVVLPFGMAFYPFLFLRSQLTFLALGGRRGNPTGLYLSGFWRSFLWCLLIFGGAFLVPCLGQAFFLFGGLAGYIGWLIVWFQGRTHEKKLRTLNLPLGRLQFGMTDLFAAVFLYAFGMSGALALNQEPGPDRQGYTIFWSGYLLLAMGFGYFVALDALRRHAEKIEGRARTVHILVVMVTSALFLPVAWLTWRSWRYALREAALHEHGIIYPAPRPGSWPPPPPPHLPVALQTPPPPAPGLPPLPDARV
ncbi:MAG: hypothetical protein KIS92_08640 [Planctomycetota bacterium]|nr:hypothetical protein [Planctomycetota bacterium]